MSNGILITGGTGSLGRTIAKKLLSGTYYNRICIYSRDEHKQETLERELGKNDRMRYFIGDVRDRDRLTFAMAGCEDVIHTAALKIIPTAEYNPMEVIKTNILGTENIIWASMLQKIDKVMVLSTDKAVSPLNLYGATKLCAEKLSLAYNGKTQTKISVARYGNVANSNGSVIPLFKKLVARGNELTITDENMTRFWITLDEVVEFVLGSLEKMNGGEIFIPKMPSFKIMDLAFAVTDTPNIKIIGVRPGEKIHEEIEIGKPSNQNDWWLSVEDLREKLRHL